MRANSKFAAARSSHNINYIPSVCKTKCIWKLAAVRISFASNASVICCDTTQRRTLNNWTFRTCLLFWIVMAKRTKAHIFICTHTHKWTNSCEFTRMSQTRVCATKLLLVLRVPGDIQKLVIVCVCVCIAKETWNQFVCLQLYTVIYMYIYVTLRVYKKYPKVCCCDIQFNRVTNFDATNRKVRWRTDCDCYSLHRKGRGWPVVSK